MKNIRALLGVQLVTALLLAVVLSCLFLIYSKSLLNLQDLQAKNAIEQIISSHVTDDGKLLSRQLERSFSFKRLEVSRLDGTMLYEQNNPSSETFFETLLQLFGKKNQLITVSDFQQDVLVRFELNTDAMKAILNTFLYFIFVFPFILLILATFLLKAILKRKYQLANIAVKNVLESFSIDSDNYKADFSKLPAEFSTLGMALNKLGNYNKQLHASMAAEAQQIAEEAYKDTVTGLPNRNRFVQTYEEQIHDSTQAEFGIFAITRCTELQGINQSRGFHAGDEYIKEVAEIIKRQTQTYKENKIFRLNACDFGIILPKVTAKEAENFAQQLQNRFNEYQKLTELDSVAYTGLVGYTNGKPLGELLATADTSISLAQTKQSNAWHLQKEANGLENAANNYGNQNWRNVIEDVINNNRLMLLLQTIQPCSRTSRAYAEVLVRFKTHEDQILPTASFFAMAEKLDKIIAIDRLIVETCLNTIKTQSMQDQYFGINLSPRSVHDEQFVIWLERRLLRDGAIAPQLIFEVSEFGLQQNLKTSKRFIDMLHRVGSRITVEKFGVGITSFKFFRDLKPDFIKMDGSYTRQIDEDKNNQYFLRLMIDLAHRIGVSVLAESVETQEEKHMLESLFIDGCQGYYIGKPQPI
ncbi:EAL domain-containing protein [Alishewanella sp. d11]|uniref:EAL domain-containing protein n=1 Tax=Alishewanella sp. d11 TaxID=3414030 RepID=UPI003BF83BF3